MGCVCVTKCYTTALIHTTNAPVTVVRAGTAEPVKMAVSENDPDGVIVKSAELSHL